MTEDQDVEMFLDNKNKLHHTEWRDLVNQKSFEEASGYVQIRCDLPPSAAGHKSCTLLDFRATLLPAAGGKPLMLLQQVKGKEGGKDGKVSVKRYVSSSS